MKRFNTSLLSLLLVLVMLFSVTACNSNSNDTSNTDTNTNSISTESPAESDTEKEEISITVEVVDSEGKSTEFKLDTACDNLGAALLEAELVEGEQGAYGLFITTVNGMTADYDADGAYWALSRDGEYLMTGADSTPIADGEHYEITYTVSE